MNVRSEPYGTGAAPAGVMMPFAPAAAVMVKVFIVNVAVTVVSAFMIT